MEHRLIISLVTWNSSHYLEQLFVSLRQQTEQNLELLVTDNASTDDTVLRLSELLPTLPYPATLFREKENIGFAHAHNHHIREAVRRKARFVLVVNPDCILEEHACAILLDAMMHNDRLGSIGGRILRAQFVTTDGLTTLQKLSTIDSTGLVMTRSRMMRERGYGESDRGQYREGPVLGVSGAFVLYRLRALVDVSMRREGHREFFDSDFFSYKEDADLAWRLQWFGWLSWYTPKAVAWHHRTFGRERRNRVPAYLRALSWRNHFFLLIKNDDRKNFLHDAPLIFFRECVKLFWILLREPRTVQLFPSLIRLWSTMLQKRRWIMSHRRQSPAAMRQMFRSFRSSLSTTKQKGS
ncbi:MAG: glycosyltransferase family 2 protein [bacterium]|nr:glycosyltransferase family 2 protein [bacterium]